MTIKAHAFRPDEILRVLSEAGVEYVVVGGLAAIAPGSSQSARDFDARPRDKPVELELRAR